MLRHHSQNVSHNSKMNRRNFISNTSLAILVGINPNLISAYSLFFDSNTTNYPKRLNRLILINYNSNIVAGDKNQALLLVKLLNTDKDNLDDTSKIERYFNSEKKLKQKSKIKLLKNYLNNEKPNYVVDALVESYQAIAVSLTIGEVAAAIGGTTLLTPPVTIGLGLVAIGSYFYDKYNTLNIANSTYQIITSNSISFLEELRDKETSLIKIPFRDKSTLDFDTSVESINSKVNYKEVASKDEIISNTLNQLKKTNSERERINQLIKKKKNTEKELEDISRAHQNFLKYSREIKNYASLASFSLSKLGLMDEKSANEFNVITNTIIDLSVSTDLYNLNNISGPELCNVYVTGFKVISKLIDNSPSPEMLRHTEIMNALQRIEDVLIDVYENLSKRLNIITSFQEKTLILLIEFYEKFKEFRFDSLLKFEEISKDLNKLIIYNAIDNRESYDDSLSEIIKSFNHKLDDDILANNTDLWRVDYLNTLGYLENYALKVSKNRVFSASDDSINAFNHSTIIQYIRNHSNFENSINAIKRLYFLFYNKNLTSDSSFANPRQWARGCDLYLQFRLLNRKVIETNAMRLAIKKFIIEGENLKNFIARVTEKDRIAEITKEFYSELEKTKFEVKKIVEEKEKKYKVALYSNGIDSELYKIKRFKYKDLKNKPKAFRKSLILYSQYHKKDFSNNDIYWIDSNVDVRKSLIDAKILNESIEPLDEWGKAFKGLKRVINYTFVKGIFKDLKFMCVRTSTNSEKSTQKFMFGLDTSVFQDFISRLEELKMIDEFNLFIQKRQVQEETKVEQRKAKFLLIDFLAFSLYLNNKEILLEASKQVEKIKIFERLSIASHLLFISLELNKFCAINEYISYPIKIEEDLLFIDNTKGFFLKLFSILYNTENKKFVTYLEEESTKAFNDTIDRRIKKVFNTNGKTLPMIDETLLKLYAYQDSFISV